MHKNIRNQKIIAVLGGNIATKKICKKAYQVGQIIAEKDCILLCGGLGGVMEASAKGAKENGGLTIGILHGTNKADANPYIDIPIVTAMSNARNAIIARTCDLAIAINGKYGTLSEIAYCLNFGKTVLGIDTFQIEGITKIESIDEIEKFL
ncbi:MAG: TIGR00725 family protein [Candidatus Cloacimonadota bacterium]|nr:TIGR00725 family protein [Candidatus Cloacimonadota bacterium]